MKSFTLFFFVFIALFMFSPVTSADVFRIDGGIGYGYFHAAGGSQNYNVDTPLIFIPLEGEIHWAGIRFGLDVGYGKSVQFDILQVSPRMGFEYNILDYKLKISEGYRYFNILDNTAFQTSYTFCGLALEMGAEWKISEMLNFHAVTVIPETGIYSRNGDLISNQSIGQQYLKIGAQITSLPLVHLNFDYYKVGADYRSENLNLYGEGFLVEALIQF